MTHDFESAVQTPAVPAPRSTAPELREETPPPPAAATGDPAVVGLPSFIVGSVALGLVS